MKTWDLFYCLSKLLLCSVYLSVWLHEHTVHWDFKEVEVTYIWGWNYSVIQIFYVTEQEFYAHLLQNPLLLGVVVLQSQWRVFGRELIVMLQHWWKMKWVLPMNQGNTTEGSNPSAAFKKQQNLFSSQRQQQQDVNFAFTCSPETAAWCMPCAHNILHMSGVCFHWCLEGCCLSPVLAVSAHSQLSLLLQPSAMESYRKGGVSLN